MIVILNNGAKIFVTKEVGQLIINALLKSREEARRWQVEVRLDGKLRAFNPEQIALICEDDDIVLI